MQPMRMKRTVFARCGVSNGKLSRVSGDPTGGHLSDRAGRAFLLDQLRLSACRCSEQRLQ
ncbi:MAG: hypothetical protein MZV70_12420 [Desulfobacterales bacterium]|nr:hypothetical protein [Desulfobacterales bacterium]